MDWVMWVRHARKSNKQTFPAYENVDGSDEGDNNDIDSDGGVEDEYQYDIKKMIMFMMIMR